MAQPATNPKIEELRFKLKADPKSRLFYQLAEELRRAGQFDESEKVLRSGLSVYPTYLAAWVSFGRVLREKKADAEAVDALNKALQLDPGNVVAARLLADAYYALGDKVEAIKKYKLVHALLPSDETLEAQIALIAGELAAMSPAVEQASPVAAAPEPVPEYEESPFDKTIPPFAQAARVLGEEAQLDEDTGDDEPMSFAHQESPFEEPVSGFGQAAIEVEAPAGIHVASAPAMDEMPSSADEDPTIEMPVIEATREDAAQDPLLYSITASMPFESEAPAMSSPATDAADTITMADLYAKQGLIEEARHIYENILSRDPENASVRAKLQDISPRTNPKIAKLEGWLARVSKREVGRV